LIQLHKIFQRHPGSCRGYVHLLSPGKTETIIGLPDTLQLNAGRPLTREVNGLLGYNAVETVCSPATSSIRHNSNRLKKNRK
jgi:DNA polymerase-3 subunit alpha